MNEIPESEKREILLEVLHNLPNEDELRAMSFADLASELSKCIKDSPKIQVIEREIKKRLAQDQAKINLPNMLYAACVGGAFALAGVVLGWHLNTPTPQKVSPASAMQQVEKSKLAVEQPSGQTPQVIVQPPANPVNKPTPKNNDAQPSKANP